MHSKPRKKEEMLRKALEEEKSDTIRAHRRLQGQGQGLCVDSSTGLKEDNDENSKCDQEFPSHLRSLGSHHIQCDRPDGRPR